MDACKDIGITPSDGILHGVKGSRGKIGLTRLNITHGRVSDNHVGPLIKALEEQNTLVELALNFNDGLTDEVCNVNYVASVFARVYTCAPCVLGVFEYCHRVVKPSCNMLSELHHSSPSSCLEIV